MDLIGVTIAYVSVLLLLSLVVSGLVQLTQATLRLRGRNLVRGIASIILASSSASDSSGRSTPNAQTASAAPKGIGDFVRFRRQVQSAKRDAARILNEGSAPLLGKVRGEISHLRNLLFGARISWIDSEDLKASVDHYIQSHKDFDVSATDFIKNFERLSDPMKKRFQLVMRLWTSVWAVAIVALYQISTPALLARLESDKSVRETLNAVPAEQQPNPTLSNVGLELWSDPAFYYSDGIVWTNVLGVLTTAMLVSLGAPFWFEQLKRIVGLRDILKKTD